MIDSGQLGQVVGVEANFSTDVGAREARQDWRFRPGECPGGPLIQLGIHHADTLQYLCGPVYGVFGLQCCVGLAKPVAATVSLLEFESGVMGHLTSHDMTASAYTIRVMPTAANVRYDRSWGLEISQDTRERSAWSAIEVKDSDPLLEEVSEFAEYIRSGGRPKVVGEEGTTALALVLAATESARLGKMVVIRELLNQA
ncbi:MAG: Gfo/Idh/MocA family oxidoreductase [Acidobacteria bacterium]|nr:Gfo/Idh/MocA family oxidoreductase [Acidobacteriota bacterium]